jgi:hypothetical protein
MSKSIIGDQLWAEMTEGQQVDAVSSGDATLKQISEGPLNGSEKLGYACRDFLAHAGSSTENLPVEVEQLKDLAEALTHAAQSRNLQAGHKAKTKRRPTTPPTKQRFGLPEGFVPRLQRYGRSVLLELNVYRLPNGQELIPCHPSGPLGARGHLYALITTEQFLNGKRGSVYVRTDGRIFDYGVDTANSAGDIFDTGYTVYDLERTGRYAPEPRRRTKKNAPAKVRRAVAADLR